MTTTPDTHSNTDRRINRLKGVIGLLENRIEKLERRVDAALGQPTPTETELAAATD